MSRQNHSNRVQAEDQRSSREDCILLFKAIQREDFSSLLQPAKYLPSSAPYLCGPFPPATGSRNQARCGVQRGRQAWLRGASPLAPDKPRPQSSALRLCRPPLRSALSIPLRCIARVGRPLGLQLLPPTFARRRSACMYTPCQFNGRG